MAAQAGRYQLRGAVPGVAGATISQTEKQFGVRLNRTKNSAGRSVVEQPKKLHQILLQKLRGNRDNGSEPTVVVPPVAAVAGVRHDNIKTGSVRNAADDDDDDAADNSGLIFKGDPDPVSDAADKKPDDDKKSDSNGFEITARLAASLGYDDNIDASEDKAASGFHRYDASFEAAYDEDKLEINAGMEVSTKAFFGRDEINEWEFDLNVDGKYDLGSDWFVGFGIGRDHDFLDEADASISSSAFVETGNESDLIGLEIRASANYDVDRSAEAADDADDDTVTASLATTLRLKPKAVLSPFIRGNVDHLTYVAREQDDDDEDVTSYSILSGLRIQPNEKLQLDVAGRFEWRDYSSPDVATLTNFFADVDLIWKPVSDLAVKGRVRRSLDTPGSDTSDYLENTEYSLGFNWNITQETAVELGGSLDLSRESDDSKASRDIAVEAKITQELSKNLGVFMQGSHAWSRSKEDGVVSEEYTRLEIWAGLELKL